MIQSKRADRGNKPYVVSQTYDDEGKEVFYCHMKGYSYIPVFGSIGDKSKANRVCKTMNRSVGYE